MKPQIQRIANDIDGDCFGACVASILELEDWPNYHSKDWFCQWQDWLAQFGLTLVGYSVQDLYFPRGYFILAVPLAGFRNRKKSHAVIYYGQQDGTSELVWDPSPVEVQINMRKVKHVYVLQCLDPLHHIQRASSSAPQADRS